MKKSFSILAAFMLLIQSGLFAQSNINGSESKIYGVVTTPSAQDVNKTVPPTINVNSCPTPIFDIPGNPLNCNSACAILAVRDSQNLTPPGTMTPGWTWTISSIDNNMCFDARVEVWSSGVLRAAVGNNSIGSPCAAGCSYLGTWAAWWGNCTPGNSYTIIQDHQSPTATTEIRMYYPTSVATFPWSMNDDFTSAVAASGTFDFSNVPLGYHTSGVQSNATGINQGTATFVCPTCPPASWSDGKNGFAQFCPTLATPGKYGCTYSFSAGSCSKSYTDTITVNSINNASWTSPGSICASASYTLNNYLTGAATTGGTWSGTNVSGGIFTPTGSGTVAITYSVGTTACKVAQTNIITVLASPTVSVTPPGPNTYCAGTPVNLTLTASGANTYAWNTAATTSSITVSPVTSTTYTVVGTSLQGCNTTTTVAVNFAPLPSVSASSTAAGCAAGTGSVNATVTSGTAPYTYLWSNGNSTSAINALAGTYSITVTDASGCTGTQTATITQPVAITSSVSSTNAICGLSNGTASSSVSGGTSPYTYSWSGGQATQNVTGLSAGTYSLTVTDANGCTNFSTVAVTASGAPVATTSASTTILSGSSTTLNSTGGVTYSWSPATNLSNTNISNPVASPSLTTKYCVTVTDISGCTDSACVTVYVNDACAGKFFVPNVFSPNGDGKNDKFRPLPVGCFKDINFSIFNRWGNVMFTTTDVTEGWDGSSEKEKNCSDGVYFYKLKATYLDGTAIEQNGTVTLMK